MDYTGNYTGNASVDDMLRRIKLALERKRNGEAAFGYAADISIAPSRAAATEPAAANTDEAAVLKEGEASAAGDEDVFVLSKDMQVARPAPDFERVDMSRFYAMLAAKICNFTRRPADMPFVVEWLKLNFYPVVDAAREGAPGGQAVRRGTAET